MKRLAKLFIRHIRLLFWRESLGLFWFAKVVRGVATSNYHWPDTRVKFNANKKRETKLALGTPFRFEMLEMLEPQNEKKLLLARMNKNCHVSL